MSVTWGPMVKAGSGRVEVAYQVTGPAGGEPLVLVAGLGAQMLYWHDELCESLVAKGFSLVRFDNRDVGLSTHLSGPTPSRVRTVVRPSSVAAYGIEEMAGDVIAVLDALGWSRSHVLGCSLGGAVVQEIAIRYPERVASLISVMSTPSLRIGRGSPVALAALLRGPVRSSEAAQARHVALYRAIGSPGFALDEVWLRSVASEEYARAYDPGGVRRQLAALLTSGDRRERLGRVHVPTLVIHGEQDPVFRPSAGAATAASVSGARLVTYEGMGHDLPRALWANFVGEICAITDR